MQIDCFLAASLTVPRPVWEDKTDLNQMATQNIGENRTEDISLYEQVQLKG